MRRDDGGYAPIRSYAIIGDGRTAALVASDGAIDWMCLPALDGGAVFFTLLDPERGGVFTLAPRAPFDAQQRYVPDSNVVETTFTTDTGVAQVRDALNLQEGRLLPWAELAREVRGVSGHVDLAWRLRPRFDFGRAATHWRRMRDRAVAQAGSCALTLLAHEAGEVSVTGDALSGSFTTREGSHHLVGLAAVEAGPLVFPHLDQVTGRVAGTARFWRQRAAAVAYEGPWRDAVVRSILALQLLIHEASGAIAAAATMALPERVGGSGNYDYRLQWVRDASFTLDAFMGVRFQAQAHASFAALQRATQRTHPRLQPMFRLDGEPRLPDEHLDLRGYRDSRPVRVGNAAAGQLQLGNYADLLDTTWRYTRHGHALDAATVQRVAEAADAVTALWRCDDSGIWELQHDRRPYTHSKMGCWLALERALDHIDPGQEDGERRARWQCARRDVRRFIEERCWSPQRRAYTFFAGSDGLDASVLLAVRMGYVPRGDERVRGTVAALRGELADGPFLYRYSGAQQREGAFLACSFWLVDALLSIGRTDEAAQLMEQVVAAANHVGLLAEEIDPRSGELLGNFPQGLSHLTLVNAALMLQDAGVR